MEIMWTLIFVVICILLEGFFSGSEMGVVSADRIKLRHEAAKGSHGRQRHEIDALAKQLLPLSDQEHPRCFQGQVGFSYAAGTHQGQQPAGRVLEELDDLGQGSFSPDQRRQRGWQVVWHRQGSRRFWAGIRSFELTTPYLFV